MLELSPAAQTYFANLLEPYHGLEEWARNDSKASRRMTILNVIMLAAVAVIAVWALVTFSVPTSTDGYLPWDIFSTEPLPPETPQATKVSLVGAALVIAALGLVAWILYRLRGILERRVRRKPPSNLTGDQISFMAAALLAQTLRKYVQTGIESYLADAKRHAMTAIGRDSSRLDYFYSGGDYDPRLVPYQFDGILSGDAAPRAAQARLAARALRSQEWVPFLGETRNWLIRFGYMARDAEYCLESEQALDDLASVGVALAETAYQSIARDQRRSKGEVDPGRTELDLAMTGLISEIAKLPRQPPRPQRSVAGATFKKRAGKALRRPRIVWEFLSWILIMLITTSFVTFVAASIWHLTEETIAVMIVPTTVIGAATITGIRAGRPSTEAVESSEDLRRPT